MEFGLNEIAVRDVEPEENVSKRAILTASFMSGSTTTKLRPRPAPFRLPVITLEMHGNIAQQL